MHLVLQLLCLELELEVFSILCRELPASAGGHAAAESPTANTRWVRARRDALKNTTCVLSMKFSFHSSKFLLMQLYGLGIL